MTSQTPAHSLDPLLKPDSIALVGASVKDGTPGNILANMVINSGYPGKVFPVNPGYDKLLDLTCYASLDALPQTVDHVVLAVSNARLEGALGHAISHGARAVTIYGSCILEQDSDPPLQQRLITKARAAGIAVCGSNGMGFYSLTQDLYAGIYPLSQEPAKGGISFIAQSGSAFSALAHNGCRLKFNLCVSSGNEMVTTTADYMDWSLEQSSTRVIGLFLETVRDPSGFVAALEKAREKKIPVVVLKVGRSPLGAQMAQTHTGAIAGDHAAYEALFKRYGVIEVGDFDEMAATLMLFQTTRRAGPGALATIQESGGFCEMVTDIAFDLDIEFAKIESATKKKIQPHLEPGLKADNPLDAWGSNDDFENHFYVCMSSLMSDPYVAAGVFFTNFRDGYYLSEAFFRIMQQVSNENQKPLAMANCYGDLAHNSLCMRSADAEIPLIDGAREALLGTKHLFEFRDYSNRDYATAKPKSKSPDKIKKWRERLNLKPNTILNELESLALLADFSIPVVRHAAADNKNELIIATKEIGYPLVLKTAAAEISHKSDQGGVVVGIEDENSLLDHYQDFSQRLGARVMLSEMVSDGIEIGLGSVNDPQFGPFIMLAAGGILIELISDRVVALCPIDKTEANEMLSSLKIEKLITGIRGQAPGDRNALVETIVSFSHLVFEFGDVIKEIDINPIIVNENGAIAVDGLVITK